MFNLISLASILLTTVSACSSAVNLGDLRVNTNSLAAIEDGSECNPFKNLNSALNALSTSGGSIVVEEASGILEIGAQTIQADITVLGGLKDLLINGQVSVKGHFSLQSISLTKGSLTKEAFKVEGRLELILVSALEFSVGLADLSGTLEVTESAFSSFTATLIKSTNYGANLSILDSTFDQMASIFNWTPISSINSDSQILVKNSQFSRNTKTSFSISQSVPSSFKAAFSVSNCNFNQASNAITLVTKGLTTSITSSQFSNAVAAPLVLRLTDGQTVIEHCTFSYLSAQAILVGFLNSHLSVKSVAVKDCSGGPAILIANSAFQASSFVELDGLIIERIYSPAANAGGILIQFSVGSLKNSKFDTMQGTISAHVLVLSSTFLIETVEFYRGESPSSIVGLNSSSVITKGIVFDQNKSETSVFGAQLSTVEMYDTTLYTCYPYNPPFAPFGIVFQNGLTGKIKGFFQKESTYRRSTILLTMTGPTTVEDVVIENFSGTQLLRVFQTSCTYKNVTVRNINSEYLAVILFKGSLTIENLTMTGSIKYDVFVGSNSTIRIKGVFIESSPFVGSLMRVVDSKWELSDFKEDQANILRIDSYISNSVVIINDSSFTSLKATFGLVSSSILRLSNVTFRDIFVPLRFLDATDSDVVFDRVSFNNVEGNFALMKLEDKSSLELSGCSFTGISIYEDNLIESRNSRVTITNSLISNFTATFIEAYDSEVFVIDSRIEDKNLNSSYAQFLLSYPGGAIAAYDTNVNVSGSTFSNLKADRGGALYSSCSNGCTLDIKKSSFFDNSATKGGAISTVQSIVKLTASTFSRNSADQGGGLDLECTESLCQSWIFNSEFFFNSAQAGGAVYWNRLKPVQDNNLFVNNTAEYGPDSASYAYSLRVISANLQGDQIVAVSGQTFQVPLVLGLYDTEGQLVSLPTNGKLTLQTQNNTVAVGALTNTGHFGMFNFSALALVASINSTVPVLFESSDIDYKTEDLNTHFLPSRLELAFLMRPCEAGEATQNSKCVKCVTETYSLDPQESKCKNCPKEATCPGGSVLILDKGFWRPNNLSDDIFPCLVPEACKGGTESECENGYQGRLCSVCENGWERIGMYNCQECPDRNFLILILFASILTVVSAFCLMVRGHIRQIEGYPVILRLFLNFFQLMSLLLTFNVSWPSSIVKLLESFLVVGTLGISSMYTDCLLTMFDTPKVFVKASLIILAPYAIFLVSFFAFKGHACIRKSKFDLKSFYAFNVAVGASLSPYILHSCFSLVSCKSMEDEKLWMTIDYDMECYTSEHIKYILILALPSLLLWGGIFPIVLFRLIKTMPEDSQVEVLRLLLFGVRSKWWLFNQMIFKNSFFSVSVLLAKYNYDVQLITGLFFLNLACYFVFTSATYENRLYKWLEFFSFITVFLSLASAFFFNSNIGFTNLTVNLVVFTMSGLFCGSMPVALIYIFLNPGIPQSNRVIHYQVAKSSSNSSIFHSNIDGFLSCPPNSFNQSSQYLKTVVGGV